MQDLFTWGFDSQTQNYPKIKEVIDNIDKIDQAIQLAASDRPITQINKVDLSILRLAIFELIIIGKEPPRAIIDEAIELAKEFGSDSSPAFVNGALGKAVKVSKINI